MNRLLVILSACCWLLVAHATSAQGGATLDELLGLPSAASERPDDSATEPVDESDGGGGVADETEQAIELDPEVARRLQQESARENPFESALVDMTQAAERLGQQQDAGLDTQRMMQEAIDKLDRVIASAKRQKGDGSDGGDESSSARGEDAGSQQMTQQNSSGRSGQAGRSQGSPADRGASPGSANDSGAGERADGAANDPLAEARREWGNLPPRVRRELTEGVNERMSPTYQDLTERYFEVLSEDR